MSWSEANRATETIPHNECASFHEYFSLSLKCKHTFCHYTLFNLKHTILFTLHLSLQCTRAKITYTLTFTYHAYMHACHHHPPRVVSLPKESANIEWQAWFDAVQHFYRAHIVARVSVQKNKYKGIMIVCRVLATFENNIIKKFEMLDCAADFCAKIVEIEWCCLVRNSSHPIQHMTISFDSIQCNEKRKVPWSRMEASSL